MMHRALMGAAAGTMAAVPMTAYWEYMHDHVQGDPPRPMPPREIAEAVAVKAGVSRQLSERDIENLALAGHFGYAALTGAIFGMIAPRRGPSAIGAGMLFGVAVWGTSYLGWLPAAGMRQPVQYDPPARTRLVLGGHLVWGAVLGIIAGTTRRRRVSTRGPARV
jgi:uncharacterized membrane protein YagU involved in acid resistance